MKKQTKQGMIPLFRLSDPYSAFNTSTGFRLAAFQLW